MVSLDRTVRALSPVVLSFVLLLIAAAGAISLSLQQQTTERWVRHTLDVESRIDHLQAMVIDAETGQRGYLLTGRPAYLAPYEDARNHASAALDALVAHTRDNPAQQQDIAFLGRLIAAKLAEIRTTIALRHDGDLPAALAIVDTDRGARLMAQIRATSARMHDREARLLAARGAAASRVAWWSRSVLVGSALLVLLLAVISVRNSRRHLRDVYEANRRLTDEIVEREAAEGKVRQLQKVEAIGQLTGGIAHDFNNMLAVILGSLELTKRRLGGGEHGDIARYVDEAAEAAQRAAVLTARLLAFSRRQPLDPKVIEVNRLVGGMSELLRRTIGEGIRIETVLAGGLWRACADVAQVESAIVNLGLNARDAMPDGGRLTVETGNADLDDRYAREHLDVKPGQYVMISVTDTGGGMPREVLDRACDPFFTTKEIGKGTGLGLSQVFGFVKQSGGHLKIYSEVGSGTTVKVYLPRHTGSDAAAEVTGRAAALLGGSPEETILVVEDEPRVRRMSVEALRDLGYTVLSTESPKEALEQLDRQPAIALLFTDIVMPEMSGRQLADMAVERRPGLKVVYTTGYTRNAVVHNGILDPGTAFLQKPFTIEQLASKIREAFDQIA